MEVNSSVKLIVSGKVQGVSFRWFTVQAARKLHLNGYAKNLDNGTVEVMAVGPKEQLQSLVNAVKKGPPFSRVDDVEIDWSEPTKVFNHFDIVH